MKAHNVVLGMMALCAGFAGAQETTGDIRGRVRSPSSGVIAGARISATSSDLQGTRSAVSASDGVFQLLALPPGTYILRVTSIGFRPVVMQGVRVQLGRMTGLADIELERAALQLSEVRIAAPRVTLDPARTTVGATLEAADYASLPAERDYKSLIAILPHVNTSYHGDPVNVGGSSGLENAYFIDGVNVTSPFQAATGTSLPSNFVRAVEVRTGGYEAQYGRALGAIVNAVTYTGTNDFESSVFGFFTHSSLAAEPRAQPTLRETGAYSYDIGARVSGPVMRDRLWFSAAYNPRIDHADRVIAGLGTFSDVRRADVFAGKLTWQARARANAELSVFGDPTTHRAVAAIPFITGVTPLNADPYLRRRESGGVAASLKTTVMLGSSSLLETSLSRSTGRENTHGDTERGRTELSYVDYVAGTIEGGSPFPIDVSHARSAAAARGTITAGRHSLAVGAEYEVGRVSRVSGNFQLTRSDTNLFVIDSQFVEGTFRNLLPAAYLQDSWRVTDGLTVNAGLRWSKQLLTGASGANAQRFADEWQPRLGFSWQLGRRGTQRLFGSYGRFYQQVPLNLASIFYADSPAKLEFYTADPRQPGVVPYSVVDLTSYESDFAGMADGLSAEHVDEFTAGYERLLGEAARLTVRGVRRDLRSAFQWAFDSSFTVVIGTAGRGDLAFLSPPRREYTALELALEGRSRQGLYRASYVLSRTWGNFPGLYGSDLYVANPGLNFGLAMSHQNLNSTGLLPNDRPHVVKLVGTYAAARTLDVGAFVTWQSGTPINDFGVGPFGAFFPSFLARRGSEGRSPAIWDVNLRLAYEAPWLRGPSAKCILDLLHVGNPRTAVRIDQQHYFALDSLGNPTTANPGYRRALAFQPPMSARLGFEVSF